MRKGMLLPAALLGGLLALCLWNGAAVETRAARWRAQLEEADRLALAGDWEEAAAALRRGYADWSGGQTYLRVVTSHDAVDSAEAMYHRCLAFAERREDSELRAELAGLRDQLRAIAEMERFSLRNVL